jgi:phage terminase large subunit GpA-like protein
MLTWFKMYEEYLRAQEDPDGMRSFETLYVGWPYKETGTRPKLERVLENKGTYKSRTVPDGVLFLTAAVDVQRGSERDASNPARLEMEICGHGAGWRTASIAYERFEGPIDDMYEGAWKLLREYSRETKMTFFRESDGRPFPVELVFVDSTDGVTEGEVYRFTQTWKNTYPTKGFSSLSRRKNETVDKVGPHDKQRYRRATFKGDVTVFTISGPHYKNMIYNNLKIQRTPDGEAPPKFCDFPCDYTEDYFKMLTAEERLEDGSFVNTAQRRNEALDLRVLNLAAADVLIDGMLEELKQAAIKAGATKAQLERYDSRRVVIDHLKKRAALQR